VRNDLRWPVSVVLSRPGTTRASSCRRRPRRRGRVAEHPRAGARPGAVGSGESTLDLQLRSATGVEIGDSVPVHVSVRAEWESVGIVVMITLVARCSSSGSSARR
jgi:hypothetical protein